MRDPTQARLKWQCRRGMKELDVLLGRWLESRWTAADDARRRSFEWLLEQPDANLVDWLIGGSRPSDIVHAALIDDIVFGRD